MELWLVVESRIKMGSVQACSLQKRLGFTQQSMDLFQTASLSLQIKGVKRIVTVSLEDAKAMVTKTAVPANMTTILQHINTLSAAALAESDMRAFHVTVSPGDVLYVPLGFISVARGVQQ